MKSTIRCAAVLIFFSGAAAMRSQTIDASSTISGFRGEFLYQLDHVEKQFISLAEAVPQEKYTWRPMEGVRSIAEAFLHVAAGTYKALKFAGITPPEGVDAGTLEKSTTDKTKILEAMRKSFGHARQAAKALSDADLEKPAEYFGFKTTVRGLFLFEANHEHEILGQAIVYARMNGIVPPWTAERQKAMESKEPPKR